MLCCLILDSYFNESKLRQRCLDKDIWGILPSVNFLNILKTELNHRPSSQTLIISPNIYHVCFLFKLSYNHWTFAITIYYNSSVTCQSNFHVFMNTWGILPSVNFLNILKTELNHRPSSQTLIISPNIYHVCFLFKLSYNHWTFAITIYYNSSVTCQSNFHVFMSLI